MAATGPHPPADGGQPSRFSWRTPRRALYAALERAYRRRGRLHVNIIIGCVCISVTTLAAMWIVNFSFLQSQIASALGTEADHLMHLLYATDVLLAALITGAVYAVLYYGVVRPVGRYRSDVQALTQLKGDDQSEALAALALDHERRAEQLDAALTDNELLRRKLDEAAASRNQAKRYFRSTMETVTDRLMLVGASGRISEISPFAAQFLGLQRDRVVGRDFDDVVHLFDAASEGAQQRRLLGLARDTIEAASPAPRIVEAQFAPMHGEAQRILVTASAVIDEGGGVSGALIRLEPYQTGDARPAAATVSGLDRVTRLPGRDQLEKRLDELIRDPQAQGVMHSLVVLAIDKLSVMTDGIGYRAAEDLMYSVAEILREKVGVSGSCYRAGAEVMAALLPWTGAAKAYELARKVQNEVDARVFTSGELRFESSVSVGIAEVPPDSTGPSQVLDNAHTALAKARFSGGGASHVYAEGDQAPAQRRSDREWTSWLRERLGGGHLRLASQEIRPLGEGSKLQPMFEVFMRVEDEDGVWVPPGAFLGAAERHQMIAELDLDVLRAVLAQLQQQPKLLDSYACACINLSAASFASEGFAAEVLQAIAMSGVPGHRICFEVDEAHALSSKAALRGFVDSVRRAGVRIALDRYRAIGGLSELRGLSIDFVKLHDSLLQCLDPAQRDEIGVMHLRWATDVTKALNMQAIATGVEQEALIAPMQTVGIRYAQGVAINKLGPLLV